MADAPTQYTVKSGDTLSSIAPNLGLDWQTLYNANKTIIGSNPDLIKPGQVLSLPGQSTQSAVIPAPDLGVATPLNLGTPPADTTAANTSIIDNVSSTLKTNLDTATAERDALVKANNDRNNPDSVSSEILTLMGQENNKASDTQSALDASGATDLAKQIADLNAQAQNVGLETQKANLALESNAAGKDVTTAFLGRQQQEITRQGAIKSLDIATRYNIAKGNYDIAKDTAQRAIDLKYLPIENKLAILKQQYDFNKDALDRIDKNRSEALDKYLKDQSDKIATQKENDKKIQDISVDAAKYGAPSDVVKKIASAKTVSDALVNAKGYLIDPIEAAYKKAQTANLYASAAKSNAAAVQGTGGAYSPDIFQSFNAIPDADKNKAQSQFGGLSKNGLLNAAHLYLADNGKIPSIGLGTSAAQNAKREAIINLGGAIADDLGLTLPQISAMYKANSSSATQIINRVARIDATSGALSSQFPRLVELADKVGNFGIQESDLTKGKAELTRKFGSEDAASYVELIQTIRSDYAAMQAAIGGGRGGEFFSRNAEEAIPLGLTGDQYSAIQQTINLSAINAQNATKDEANALIGNIGQPSLYGGVTLPNQQSDNSYQGINLPN